MCNIAALLSLCRSEGPAQVFLIILTWLITSIGHLTPEAQKEIVLIYDNMCQVDSLKVARKPLPLPENYQNIWLNVQKIIDTLHIKNHKNKRCHEIYHPTKIKDTYPDMNTMACEQTFAWLGRFKKILPGMGKRHHHFFLHRMVKRRNKYIEHCYLCNRRPFQPKK